MSATQFPIPEPPLPPELPPLREFSKKTVLEFLKIDEPRVVDYMNSLIVDRLRKTGRYYLKRFKSGEIRTGSAYQFKNDYVAANLSLNTFISQEGGLAVESVECAFDPEGALRLRAAVLCPAKPPKTKERVPFEDLASGDRFKAYGSLWTKLMHDAARRHGNPSGGIDTICGFTPSEQVEFLPPEGV